MDEHQQLVIERLTRIEDKLDKMSESGSVVKAEVAAATASITFLKGSLMALFTAMLTISGFIVNWAIKRS